MKYVVIIIALFSFGACKKDRTEPQTRSYRMGFQNSAPRFDDISLFLQSLNLWTSRADAAMITTEVPWKELMSGTDAATYVIQNYKALVDFYRSKNLLLWVYIDPQNGLDRTADATSLSALGKSIANADAQQKYKSFVLAMDSLLRPEHLGLALETNLIRFASTGVIYAGIRKAANEVAVDLKSRKSAAKLSVSVQAEMAWGKLAGNGFAGITQDLQDFPFIEEIGISSYPYLVFKAPAEVPSDYYSRILASTNLRAFVSEGGWASGSINSPSINFSSSPEIQKQYFEKHHELLQSINASALFQLPFTDIDITAVPPPVPASLVYFTTLGMLDVNMKPKPALQAWDNLFSKKLQ